jgi:hypothetical protein
MKWGNLFSVNNAETCDLVRNAIGCPLPPCRKDA